MGVTAGQFGPSSVAVPMWFCGFPPNTDIFTHVCTVGVNGTACLYASPVIYLGPASNPVKAGTCSLQLQLYNLKDQDTSRLCGNHNGITGRVAEQEVKQVPLNGSSSETFWGLLITGVCTSDAICFHPVLLSTSCTSLMEGRHPIAFSAVHLTC